MNKRYIGVDKPKIKYIKEKSNWVPTHTLLEEDGDYLPVDAQGLE